MKKLLTLSLFALSGFFTANAQYCVPDPGFNGCSDGDLIDDFVLFGENNTYIINNNTGCALNAYADLSAQSVDLALGVTYTANISTTFAPDDNVAIFIDFNDNFTFEPSELVGQLADISLTGSPVTIAIPLAAATGQHRMRVSLRYDVLPSLIDPCNTGGLDDYGETHDYTVNIVGQPTCPAATSLQASAVTTSSANISWLAVGMTTPPFGLEYGPAGFIPGTGTYIATTPSFVTLNMLSANTEYSVYVRQVCSSTDSSAAIAINFKTLCNTVNLPYSENFDGVAIPAIPDCMIVEDNNSDNELWITNDFVSASAPNSIVLFGSFTNHNDWFFTPGINMQNGFAYEISFKYTTGGGPMALEVRSGTLPTQNAQVPTPYFNDNNLTNTTFQTATFTYFAGYTGAHYFSWHSYSQALSDFIAVDDINITALTPVCDTTNAIIATAITVNSATINWTPVTGATGYEYVLDQVSTDPVGAGTPTTNTTYNASGLLSNTVYYFHVRTVCGSGVSAWATYMFTTMPVSVVNVNEHSDDINVYPNPVKDVTTLVVSDPIGRVQVQVTDMSGKVMYRSGMKGDKLTIDMSRFSSGVYFIHYRDDIHDRVIKVVK